MPALPLTGDAQVALAPPVAPQVNGSGSTRRELKVLVTGFGVSAPSPCIFTDGDLRAETQLWGTHTLNPSSQIVSLLPDRLTTPHASLTLITRTLIPVSWRTVAELLPRLIDQHHPDLILHVGLDNSRSSYNLEETASKPPGPGRDVSGKDVNGEVWTAGDSATHATGWEKDTLRTGLDYPDVVRRWYVACAEAGIPTGPPEGVLESSIPAVFGKTRATRSDKVGNFLCGFSYYTSLAHTAGGSGVHSGHTETNGTNGHETTRPNGAGVHGDAASATPGGPVLFLHVPMTTDQEGWALGKTITQKVIESMGESLVSR